MISTILIFLVSTNDSTIKTLLIPTSEFPYKKEET